jgi:PIN domain nuclease of toxin-antitoxin system
MAVEPDKLTAAMRDALNNPDNSLALSVASAWEIQIKAQIGKLRLSLPPQEFITIQRSINNIRSLPVLERHIWALDELPLHHKDPFDRLLLAQAAVQECHLVSADSVFAQYAVPLLQ